MFTVILCALYVYSIVFHLILTCKTSWRQFSWYVARDEDESYKTNLEHSLILCLLSEIWWWLKEKPFILSNNGISWYKAFSSKNVYLQWDNKEAEYCSKSSKTTTEEDTNEMSFYSSLVKHKKLIKL